MNKLYSVSFLTGIVLTVGIFTADARPEYAQKEGKPCSYCHLNPAGGGARGFRGQFYGANGLSFEKFDEAREASIAGVDSNLSDAGTRPKVFYVGTVSGPADKQIQSVAIRGRNGEPVIVAFFDSASDQAKSAAKTLHAVAAAYGRKVAVVGVTEGDEAKALQLTKDLGSQIRILPDADGAAIKKFSAAQGLDLVVVAPMGASNKLYSGFSKGNLEAAIAQIGTFDVEAPQGLDLGSAPKDAVHGGKLGG
ncbi:MAG TPA: hypothetical protein VMI31_15640 [Fimbriimonadaceae bacterium]|nr:hypothetical protein [Fimbriimonadaceae bacterium]